MTNNELLHASLLYIVFEDRNKEYGAYVLRKEYKQRMFAPFGIGISLILFVALVNDLNSDGSFNPGNQPTNDVIISCIEIPVETTEKSKPPAVKPALVPLPPKAVESLAAVEFPLIALVPDIEAGKKLVATPTDLLDKQIATANADGKDYTGEVVPPKVVWSSDGQDNGIILGNHYILSIQAPNFREDRKE